MSEATDQQQGSGTDGEVVRWYTRARKVPQLIGRTPDGTRIWGGPYTITQVVGGGLVLVLALNTMGAWARFGFGFFGNVMVLAAVTVVVIVVLGRIPVGSRNPLSVVSAALHAVSAPRHGRVSGQKVLLRRPRRVRHRVLVEQTPGPAVCPRGPEPQPTEATPTPAQVRDEPRPLTGVQSLLAAAAKENIR